MGKVNPYYKWNLFDLLDHIKQTEDKMDELEATMLSFGMATQDDKKMFKSLKEQLALMNAELNDKTK